MKKCLTALAAVLILSSCQPNTPPAEPSGGYGNTEPQPDIQVQETAAQTEEPVTEAETEPAETAPAEPIDLEKGLTDNMYARALMNEGNKARLAKMMKKAKAGGSITVGVIGGSITQGTAAGSPAQSYAGLFNEYWCEKFPEAEVNFVNAGIGGTNSYLGVHRVDEQLLSAKPDVVIVEFSVNDSDRLMNKYSYDSLVRKILNSESQPAVILLFTTQENGTSLQETHFEIGTAYNLPCLSYREAVFPEVQAGTLNWKDISPDNIHPNNEGHRLIGQIISRYLDGVYDDLDNIDGDTAFDIPAYTADYYKNARILTAADIEPNVIWGFEVDENKVYPTLFHDNFVAMDEGYMSFEVDCACLGFFYLKTTDGSGGKYEVYIDGERKGVMDANFAGGWGNYGETQQFLLSKETAHHTVEVKLAEGSEKTALTILGVLTS